MLDAPGQQRVLAAARVQTCRASQTKNPELAVQTQAMLDAYVDMHAEHGVEPSWRLERKIAVAHRDAEATRRGVATPYFLGCDPFTVPTLRARAQGRRSDRLQAAKRQSRRSLQPSGVIRNPRR
ncbi:MAG: hypothetical protein ACE37F_24145 [Nannocystaceae bacterium]|nr:hypothetical protein [bacterium]